MWPLTRGGHLHLVNDHRIIGMRMSGSVSAGLCHQSSENGFAAQLSMKAKFVKAAYCIAYHAACHLRAANIPAMPSSNT